MVALPSVPFVFLEKWQSISAIRVLGEVATGTHSGSPVTALDVAALQWLTERLATAVPSQILTDKARQPIVILTDAASEENNHTVGGMFYDELNNLHEYFGCTIFPSWSTSGSRRVQYRS